jgi:hypothetical protein
MGSQVAEMNERSIDRESVLLAAADLENYRTLECRAHGRRDARCAA